MRRRAMLLLLLALFCATAHALEPPRDLLVRPTEEEGHSRALSRHRRFIFPTLTGSTLNAYLTFTFPVEDAVWPLVFTYPYTIFLETGS